MHDVAGMLVRGVLFRGGCYGTSGFRDLCKGIQPHRHITLGEGATQLRHILDAMGATCTWHNGLWGKHELM